MRAVCVQTLICFLGLTLLASSVEAADPPWASTPPEIVGSDRFKNQVNAALTLIKTKSPETHQLIQRRFAHGVSDDCLS